MVGDSASLPLSGLGPHRDPTAAGVTGNTLTTTWGSSGGARSVETDRDAGESDGDFLARHLQDVLLAMLVYPPVP